MFSRIRSFAPLICILALGLGCSDGFGPASTCLVRARIEVCTDRDEYAPGSKIRFTITNRGSQTVFFDACSYEISGRSREALPFEWEYKPTRQCGPDATIEDVLANMRTIEPGSSQTDGVTIQFGVFQGFYRVGTWRVDASGALADDEPYTSNDFNVLPSAN